MRSDDLVLEQDTDGQWYLSTANPSTRTSFDLALASARNIAQSQQVDIFRRAGKTYALLESYRVHAPR